MNYCTKTPKLKLDTDFIKLDTDFIKFDTDFREQKNPSHLAWRRMVFFSNRCCRCIDRQR